MSDWRRTAKTIVTTFLVTSAAWLIGGAVLFARWQGGDDPTATAPRADPGSDDATLASSLTGNAAPGQLAIPVVGVRPDQLVDTFTQAREGGVRIHDAIDIMAARGTPVVAAAPGRIEKLFVSARGGNTVYVRSPDRRFIYYYAHLDSYAPGVVEGATVRTGEPIGAVGSTGNADPAAPHLHFAILRSAPEARWSEATIAINPYSLLTRQR